MEKQFQNEKTEEFLKDKKYTLKKALAIISYLLITACICIYGLNSKNELYEVIGPLCTSLAVVVIPIFLVITDSKIEENTRKYIEQEERKKVKKMFIAYEGKRKKEVYYALKNIVFSEERPTRKEIDTINEITRTFNELKEEIVSQKIEVFEEKLDQYIENLSNRKYYVEEIDVEFEEKQKGRLERIINTYELKLNFKPTNENIEEMIERCELRMDVQKELKLSNHALEDIIGHLKKINESSKKLKEGEVKTISSVVNEIIVMSREQEKKVESETAIKIEEKLTRL